MAARAAEEDIADSKKNVTPYWRTMKGKGELNEKYPGGVIAQSAKLRTEGHEIEKDKAGKPKRVKDWESKLVKV
jgi:hypothetical protein